MAILQAEPAVEPSVTMGLISKDHQMAAMPALKQAVDKPVVDCMRVRLIG